MEELSFFRKLSVNGQKLGMEVLVFTPDDVDKTGTRIYALKYNQVQGKWIRKWTGFPTVIYDRCRYHGMDNFHKLTRFRKRYSTLRYLSKPLTNKWSMHQLLAENPNIEPHLPETIKYHDVQELGLFLNRHPLVYMKPKSGTGGRGIIKIQRIRSSDAYLLQGRDPNRNILPVQKVTLPQIPAKLSGWNLEEKYIVQQGIPLRLKDGRVHDFRMLVQKNGKGEWQVTGCAGRIGPKRSVTSNLHGGGTAIPMDTLLKNRFGADETVNSIKKSAYALGLHVVQHLEDKFGMLCEVGIDLAIDPKGHVWLLEVNPKPSREVFYRIGELETYRNAIKNPLEYALWLNKQKISGVTR